MPIRRLRTFNNNKRTLLDNIGYRSVKSFRNDNPEYRTNNQAYTALLGLYNEEVDRLNADEERIKKEQKRLKAQKARLQARLQRRNVTQYYKEKKQNYSYAPLYSYLDVATKIAKKDKEKYSKINTTL